MNKKLSSTISSYFKTHIVDALSFMAMGLFCSLILGLIIKQIALIPGLDFLSSCVPSSALLGTVTASFFYSETVLETTLPLAQNTERPHCFEATLQPNYMRGRFCISIPKISLLHVC